MTDRAWVAPLPVSVTIGGTAVDARIRRLSGAALRRRRRQWRLPRAIVAACLGCSPEEVRDAERGQLVIDLGCLIRWARLLDLDPREHLDRAARLADAEIHAQ